MTLYHRLYAWFIGKKVFIIPKLKRTMFATSYEQCKSKFRKHNCVQAGKLESFKFIIFG